MQYETANSRSPLTFYGAILLIVFLSLTFRLFTSMPVEFGGDAIYKWSLVKQFLLFGDLPARWNHHACRWAVNIPAFFIMKFFGTGANVYYFWPFLTATLSAVFSFLLLERIRGWRVGLAGAILVVLSVPMLRMGSQFLPMGATVTFLLGSLYFLLRWRDNGRNWNVAVSALLLFLAYGTKVTSVYYLPACLVLIWLLPNDNRGRVWSMLLFIGVFMALLALETYLFNILGGATFGRWELIQQSHHPIRTPGPVASWRSVSKSLPRYLANFLVYLKYPGGLNSILYYAAFSISALAWVKKWRNTYIVAVPFVFGFLGIAYAITSVFPFSRPERLLFRYQTPIFELALLTVVLFLSVPRFEKCVKKYKLPFNVSDRAIRGLLFLTLVLLIAVPAFKGIQGDTGYEKTVRTMELVSKARENNLPVFIPTKRTDMHTFKQIIKYWSIFSDAHWRVPFFESGNLSSSVDYQLEKYSALKLGAETYILVERNGFSGDISSKAVFLTDF